MEDKLGSIQEYSKTITGDIMNTVSLVDEQKSLATEIKEQVDRLDNKYNELVRLLT
jgi:archaellum component FlaC